MELQVLDEIRIMVEENHIFYLKATKKDGYPDHYKYDIIIMMDPAPLATTENEDQFCNVKDAPCASQRPNSTAQQLLSTVKRMLFDSPTVSASNKIQNEESHNTNKNPLLKGINTSSSTVKDKNKDLVALISTLGCPSPSLFALLSIVMSLSALVLEHVAGVAVLVVSTGVVVVAGLLLGKKCASWLGIVGRNVGLRR
ncbi:Uncharacterized protein Fot_31850 [Forsythia ovata]|uniref:Uncharacterized protein n=1 Tax=Forsythia ovata TaxID=205694 RepID=A0ABD1T6P9_9LAMI